MAAGKPVGRNRFIAPLRGLVSTVDLLEAAQTAQCAEFIIGRRGACHRARIRATRWLIAP
jgi:hypothetical protein